jgi:hypothetical protein
VALVCNIDQRGRALRYRIGTGLVIAGIVLALVASRFMTGFLPWLLGAGVVAGGLFSWFEANRGWCAARALGIKTRV